MTLRVDPNGQQESGKGTHVDVYMCLMKGANDNNLQFPMTGIFTVQVMNWKGNSEHVILTIKFDDDSIPVEGRERVATGELAYWGRGLQQFMSHDELKQYVHEDKICIKITFCPLG